MRLFLIAMVRRSVAPCVGLLAVACLWASPLLAQRLTTRVASSNNGLVHESWGVAEGLPVNSITHLLQTRDGYLWAATFDGLVRFDGVRFTTFNTANSGLPSDRIIRMIEGVGADLWLVTEQRHVVRFRNGRFVTVVAPDVSAPRSTPVLVDPKGTTWIGTRAGLARVDGDTIVVVARDQVRDTVLAMTRRQNGDMVVATSMRGVLQLHLSSGADVRVSTLPVAAPGLRGLEATDVYEAPDGELFVGFIGALWSGKDTLRPLAVPGATPQAIMQHIRADPRGRGTLIFAQGIYRAQNGRVTKLDERITAYANPAFWTDTGGVWHARGPSLMREGQTVLALESDSPAELRPGDITTGLIDREGSIWLGTYANGLHRLKPTTLRTISRPEGLRTGNVYGTGADPAGHIWVGSLIEGYARIDARTGQVSRYSIKPNGEGGPARAFLVDREGALWIGSGLHPRGLFRCATAVSDVCTPQATVDRIDDVRALFEDSHGDIWIGAESGLFRRHAGVIELVPDSRESTRAMVRAIAESPDGAIWLGTDSDGLLRFRDGVFSHITVAEGLPSKSIRALHAEGDGTLWIGTEGRGLARLDTRAFARGSTTGSRAITTIGVREGLFDNVIHQILADDQDRLWMSTNRGIFWVSRREANAVAEGRSSRVHSTGYTERDGMRNREGNGGFQPSGARTADGRLWFPTQDGVVIVDPRAVQPDRAPPPLRIERVVAGDSGIAPENGEVSLSSTQRDARIEYTALTFIEPRNVRFRYRLEGYDDAWVDAADRRTAFYTKLPAGHFTFRLQASRAGSDWYEPGASIKVNVAPRLTERTAFRASVLLLALGLAGTGVRRRSRVAQRRARELETLVQERTAALQEREHRLAEQNDLLETQATQLRQLDEARTRFFANVSHELRTPLTLTIGPLENLRAKNGHDADSTHWLDLAVRNAQRLLSLVNQLLDVAKLEAGAVRLTPRPLDVVAFLQDIFKTFVPMAEQKRVRLHLEAPAEFRTDIDHDALEKIATNLLSNAVKFTPPAGHVHVTLSTPPGLLVLTVRNTGPAIPADQLRHVFERFYQVDESNTSRQPGTGIGLSLVKELVDLQRGIIRVTSDATGTVFVVTLPISPEAIDTFNANANSDAASITQVKLSKGADDAATVASGETSNDIPTILVADDSEDMRSFVAANFKERYRVFEASNGNDALALARSELPDVIISDVMMPGLDGRALVHELRASPDTDFLSVILLTAQAERAQRLAGLEGGADEYLVKPFDMRELDVRVRNVLAARRRLRDHLRTQADSPPFGVPAANASMTDEAATSTNRSPEDEQYLQRVHAAIRAKLSDADFGVTELADDVFQDRSHLFRRVRDLTGLTPSEMLRHARLEEAAQLLTQRQGTVADVAFSVGFRSVSHFCRAFQDHFTISPATYRDASPEVRASARPSADPPGAR